MWSFPNVLNDTGKYSPWNFKWEKQDQTITYMKIFFLKKIDNYREKEKEKLDQIYKH